MRELRAQWMSREDVEALDGVIAIEAHMFHPGQYVHYPYLHDSKENLQKIVDSLNSHFPSKNQQNLEIIQITIENYWILVILRDKRKNNKYFNSLEEVN